MCVPGLSYLFYILSTDSLDPIEVETVSSRGLLHPAQFRLPLRLLYHCWDHNGGGGGRCSGRGGHSECVWVAGWQEGLPRLLPEEERGHAPLWRTVSCQSRICTNIQLTSMLRMYYLVSYDIRPIVFQSANSPACIFRQFRHLPLGGSSCFCIS